MSSIRDQQESLAKLHFDIGARQDPSAPLSEEGLRAANDNLDRLMARLEKLSDDIGQLHPASSTKNSPSSHPTEPSSLEQPKLDRWHRAKPEKPKLVRQKSSLVADWLPMYYIDN